MINDAVRVYCEMDLGESCVFADPGTQKLAPKHWTKPAGTPWFSQIKDGFKFTYESIGSVQMNFLRLLSSRVYQNVTINCVNSIMWFDAKEQNFAYGVRLMGESGQEWSANRKHIKPNVLQDHCTNGDPNGKTVLEVRTNKIAQLPIIDFLPLDYGKPHQAFGFELGPVCFS